MADWLMVIITAIYAGVTMLIMFANRGATKAAQEQLAESKRQFSETKRLEMMPYFEIRVSDGCLDEDLDEPSDKHTPLFYASDSLENKDAVDWAVVGYTVSFSNIGLGTAKDFSYTYKYLDKEEKRDDLGFTTCSSGEEKNFCFNVFLVQKENSGIPVTLTFYYSDLLENMYSVDLELKFSLKPKWEDEWDVRLIEKKISKPMLINKSANW